MNTIKQIVGTLIILVIIVLGAYYGHQHTTPKAQVPETLVVEGQPEVPAGYVASTNEVDVSSNTNSNKVVVTGTVRAEFEK